MRYRTLATDFLAQLRDYGGPPPHYHAKRWFEAHGLSCRRNMWSGLINGHHSSVDHINALVTMLLEDTETRKFAPSRDALLHFLRERGVFASDVASMEAILGHVCQGREVSHPPDRSRGRFRSLRDWLVGGVRHIMRFPVDSMIRKHVRGCPPAEDHRVLRDAVRWMYIRVGQDSTVGRAAADATAIAAAEARIKCPLEAYQAKAIEWQGRDAWTLILATNGETPVGTSTILPVTSEFYERVRAGIAPTWECTARDIVVPSKHLIIENGCASPAADADYQETPSTPLLMCIAIQCGAMVRYRHWSPSATFSILSFEGTPQNAKRMLKNGFRPTHTRMANTDLPLVERHIGPTGDHLGFLERSFLKMSDAHCPETPPLLAKRP